MVRIPQEIIAREERRIRNLKLRNAGKLLTLAAAVAAIIAYGALA